MVICRLEYTDWDARAVHREGHWRGGEGRRYMRRSSKLASIFDQNKFRGIAELSYFMDNLIKEGRYNKAGQSIGRCGRFFLLVALGVITRGVYKVKDGENVPHLFAQMGLNRLVSDRVGLTFRGVIVLMAGDPIHPERIPQQLGLLVETLGLRKSSESAPTG